MLAWHEEGLLCFDALEHLIERVKFLGFGAVREVPGVNHELRRHRQGVDPVDGYLQRCSDVGVRRFVETHMTVADLHEVQPALWHLHFLAECLRTEDAAADAPQHSRAGPGHAFQKSSAVDSVAIVVVHDFFCQFSPL